MKLSGYMYDFEGMDEYSWLIPEAVVTTKRIAFDWNEDGEELHALLTSTDGGCTYKGCFGSPEPDKRCVMEAERYESKASKTLLVIRWHRRDSGDEGHSLIELATQWE